jgi:very-short-patch-repair endonuclease
MATEGTICAAEGNKSSLLSLQPVVARQHGVISTAQLGDAGVGRSTISRWTRGGRLHRLHPGVYAVGHASLRAEGLQMAAVLAAGPGALLGRRAAAHARDMRRDSGPTFEVVTPGRRARSVPGIHTYHFPLHPDDRSELNGVPMTSVARTCVDVAGVVAAAQLPTMLQRADDLRILDRRALDEAIERSSGRQGIGALRAALAELDPDPAFVRSEFERRMRRLLRARGLPMPDSNPWTEIAEIDLVWSAQRVAMELDGYETHRGRLAFERDRERSLELEARGYRVLRVSWRQFTRRPDRVLAALTTVLASRGAA